MSKFKIDFIELSFLAEACIPPRPIARAYFWQNLTDKYWHQMTPNERARLFEWLNRNSFYQQGLEDNQEDVLIFHARFDPNNQYMVTAKNGAEEETNHAFKKEDRYWIGTTRYIAPEYITNIEKIEYNEQ